MAVTVHTYPASGLSAMEFLDHEKFCAVATAKLNASRKGPVSLTDVFQMIPVVKGLLVTSVRVRVDVSSTKAGTIDIGDGDDTNGYDTAVALKTANGTITRSAMAVGYGAGKLYTDVDTIDIKFAISNIVSGTVTLIAEGVVLPQYA